MTRSTRNRIILLALTGIGTAIAALLLQMALDAILQTSDRAQALLLWLLVIPGLLFGATFAIILRLMRRLTTGRAILWGIVTLGGYVVAASIVLFTTVGNSPPHQILTVLAGIFGLDIVRTLYAGLVGAVAGLIGSTALVLVSRPCLKPDSLWLLLATGTLLGALFGIPLLLINEDYLPLLLTILQAIWQGGVAAVLGWRLRGA